MQESFKSWALGLWVEIMRNRYRIEVFRRMGLELHGLQVEGSVLENDDLSVGVIESNRVNYGSVPLHSLVDFVDMLFPHLHAVLINALAQVPVLGFGP